MKRFHTSELVRFVVRQPNICYASDGVLTPAEQAAMDADRAAEIDENAGGTETPAAAAEEIGGEEAGATEQPAADGTPQRQGMVPHAALHEERTRRQETERQLAEERRRMQTMEERTNLILQRFAAPQQQAPAAGAAPTIPAFEEDPAGHILGQVRQQGAILGELVQAVTGQARQSEASQGMQQLTMRAAAMERDFAAANPDYDKASSHLFNMRRQELIEAGWTDPAEIQTMMANEATGLAARALQQGRDPAAVVYALAKLRGYVPAAEEVATAVANGGGNGTTEGQLRTIAAGQQQSRTTGNLRGAGPAPLTAARLADMSPEEFTKVMKTREGRALMGE